MLQRQIKRGFLPHVFCYTCPALARCRFSTSTITSSITLPFAATVRYSTTYAQPLTTSATIAQTGCDQLHHDSEAVCAPAPDATAAITDSIANNAGGKTVRLNSRVSFGAGPSGR